MRVTVAFTSRNPATIWNRLAVKLGRQPTNAEAIAEVRRIISESMVDAAGKGRLPFQRKQRKH